MSVSLCFPDSNKSCFGCCPPIRPPGYDHADYKNIIKRVLRENSSEYKAGETGIKPVTGYSCWGLGYIDSSRRLIGCLLHPMVNNGNDLRYRIDYGNKCARERCREEQVFSMMNPEEQSFWLSLTCGMDSFEYSSRKHNPLFRILGWGNRLLAAVTDNDRRRYPDMDRFFEQYPFFTAMLSPKGNSLLINSLVSKKGAGLLKDNVFKGEFESFSKSLIKKIMSGFKLPGDGCFVHKLGIDMRLSDFIRINLNVQKADIYLVNELHDFVKKELEIFCGKI